MKNTTLLQNLFLGELKGAYWINAIILCVKKSIFNAKLKDTMPTLGQVKANVMVMYKYEEHRCMMKNKEHVFGKQWGLFKNHLKK